MANSVNNQCLHASADFIMLVGNMPHDTDNCYVELVTVYLH